MVFSRLFYAFATLLVFTACTATPDLSTEEKACIGVISRSLGRTPKNIDIKILPKETDYYTTEVSHGKLIITAGTPTAACRGFYDWAGEHHLGISTWSVNNLRMPRRLRDEPSKTVQCSVPFRYFYNTCTFGYTTPYWSWDEWEKELDRVALHGINMIMFPVGFEAIFARVWHKLGLTDEEISDFETGPAYLPWNKIGNMSKLDGGLGEDYYSRSIELAHKMLDRMQELGITPIFYAFSGFVPDGIKRLYPDVELIDSGWRYGPYFVSNFLSPETELFHKIAKLYYSEWEAEFGKGKYFIANSFSEMQVPFAPQGTDLRFEQIARYGRKIYNSIHDNNPEAIWVLGGWMFGYQRHIWDPESIRAMFSDVPDDKMMLIDLASDFNNDIWESSFIWDYTSGIYNKPWIYSTVPNFGGRTVPVGNLEYYLNGHLNALNSPNRGKLSGIGSAPEGVENNDVLYELAFDAPWHSEHRDIHERLHEYSLNRYGKCPPELDAFWDGMLASSYGFTSSQAIYRLQRSPYFLRGGRYDTTPAHFSAIESFFDAGKELGKNPTYREDLAFWAGIYAFGKADILADETTRAYKLGDLRTARELRARFRDAMLRADRFLESNPLTRLERWTEFARAFGNTPEEKTRYEMNARRIITTWGAGRGDSSLNDYASRIWSGLIRDYYLPRWEHWFDSLEEGVPFDFDNWEYSFAENGQELSSAEAYGNLQKAAADLVSDFKDISLRPRELPGWTPYHLKKGSQRFSYMLYPADYKTLKGLGFKHIGGDGSVRIDKIRLRGAKQPILDAEAGFSIGKDNPYAEIRLHPGKNGPVKYIYLDVFVTADRDGEDSDILIELK